MKMILKYSFLNTEETLVKYLKNRKYGIYDLRNDKVVLEAEFEYIGIDNDEVIGKKGINYYKINLEEYTYSILHTYELSFFYYKNDRCPVCGGIGCGKCSGLGFIMIPGISDNID